MNKRLVSLLLTTAMVGGVLPAASAAGNGLDNFQKSSVYTAGQFADVAGDEWYGEYVKAAYEYGLVKGSGDNFDPGSNITIGSTLALACRLHNIYNGGNGIFEQGSPWYQVYVDYAIQYGIISAGEYADYNANATRAQFASILAAALPSEALTAINTVQAIPDVAADASYATPVYRLYRAGVLTGSDAAGTFNPTSYIQRSEVATIVTRMAEPGLRKSITLVGTEPVESSLTPSATSLTISEETVVNITVQYDPSQYPDGPDLTAYYDSEIAIVEFGEITGTNYQLIITPVCTGTSTISVCFDDDESVSAEIEVTVEGYNANLTTALQGAWYDMSDASGSGNVYRYLVFSGNTFYEEHYYCPAGDTQYFTIYRGTFTVKDGAYYVTSTSTENYRSDGFRNVTPTYSEWSPIEVADISSFLFTDGNGVIYVKTTEEMPSPLANWGLTQYSEEEIEYAVNNVVEDEYCSYADYGILDFSAVTGIEADNCQMLFWDYYAGIGYCYYTNYYYYSVEGEEQRNALFQKYQEALVKDGFVLTKAGHTNKFTFTGVEEGDPTYTYTKAWKDGYRIEMFLVPAEAWVEIYALPDSVKD